MGFYILEEASGIDTRELYNILSVHLTDATNHNKGITVALAQKNGPRTPSWSD